MPESSALPDPAALIANLRGIASAGTAISTAMGAGARTERSVEAWRQSGLGRGQLHELYALDGDDAASVVGFAVACALLGDALPVFWIRTRGAERQGGKLHGAGLADLGLAPAAVSLALVADEAALLRAAADAARCTGIGTLVIESWGRADGLDLTGTRRLMLAAEASGVCVVSLRIAATPSPSAAATRWGITAVPSRVLDADAPGGPAFAVELLRHRGGPAGMRWLVEWNRDAKTFTDINTFTDIAALSGARLPLAPDRAAAPHSGTSVRRTG